VQRRQTRILVAWTVLVSAVLMASNLWWLDRNELPDGFQNEYEHYYTITEVFFRARDDSLADAWPFLWDGYYPPLEHAVASAGMLVIGRSREAPVLALGLFVVVLLGAVGWAGRRLKDPETAMVAVGVLALCPAIFGNARRYEPNVALAAMVAAAACLLLVRGGLDRWRTAIGFGVLCGLGMLADRIVFAIYLLPMAVGAWVLLARQSRPERLAGLLRWVGAVGVAIAVCSYYYVRFLAGHIDEVFSQIGGEVLASGETTQSLPAWTPKGLLYYPLSWLDCQIGPVLGAAVLAGLVLWFVRGRRDVEPDRRLLLEAWLLGGLLVVTLVSKKQPFYSIPLLAPAALAAAMGWRSLADVRLRRTIAVIALLFGLHQFGFLTADRGLAPTPGRWSWFAGASPMPAGWLGYEYTQAAPPLDTGLHLERMADLCGHQRDKAPERPYTMIFSSAHGAYEGQLMPALRLELDSRLVEGVLMNGPAVQDHADRASCFVHVTEGDSGWPQRDEIVAEWAEWSVGEPTEAFFAALATMEARSYPLDRWTTTRGDKVHVFTLVPLETPPTP
jgi:4-amino-4-deoxy-L-arabinose transferase-like glycosyltransferase